MGTSFIICSIIIIIVCTIGAFWSSSEQDKIKNKQEKQAQDAFSNVLKELTGFVISRKFLGEHSSFILAIDDENNNIFYSTGLFKKKQIKYADIISVELIENNSVISSKSTVRTVGGAIAGGILLGGAGAIVGGLSGDSKQKRKVSLVAIKIKIRDINNPSLTINCFDATRIGSGIKEVDPNSFLGKAYMVGIKQATEMMDVFSVIIDKADSMK